MVGEGREIGVRTPVEEDFEYGISTILSPGRIRIYDSRRGLLSIYFLLWGYIIKYGIALLFSVFYLTSTLYENFPPETSIGVSCVSPMLDY